MIKGVIFDVDGTLLDSMPMWKNLDYEFLESVGVVPDDEYTAIVNKMTLIEGVKYTKERFSLSMTEEEIMNRIHEMAGDFYRNEATLKPYVRDFLEKLSEKGIPMTIATSSERAFIAPALIRNHVDHYFKEIMSCADTGINKNDPDVFLRAAACLGTKPEDTWVFEDSYHALMTAKSAGFPTVAVYDLSNEPALPETIREADIYIEDLKDFERFFQFAENFTK